MTHRSSITSQTFPARLSRSRTLCRALSGWRLRPIRRAWYVPPPLPTVEEAEERMRGHRGFFASLTPEQLAFVKAWDGPEISGDPNGPKRLY